MAATQAAYPPAQPQTLACLGAPPDQGAGCSAPQNRSERMPPHLCLRLRKIQALQLQMGIPYTNTADQDPLVSLFPIFNFLSFSGPL